MELEKLILSVLVSLLMAVPASSEQQNEVTGEVTVLTDNDKTALVRFEACEKTDNQPAEGSFDCSMADGNRQIYVDIRYVKADQDYAWLAGKCTRDTGGMRGRWLFVVAHDGGTPGRLVDHIWWDWLPDTAEAESIAKRKIENLEKPQSNKPIETGNIVVRYSNQKK